MDASRIADYAIGALGKDRNVQDVAISVAIALSESGGNETKVNRANSDGSIDVGLWQINSIHRKSHPTWTESWLKNPENNASAMAVVSANGTDWTPWVDYRNGKYEKHLNLARAAVLDSAGFGNIPIVDELPDVIEDPLESIGDTLRTAYNLIADGTRWITNPDNWIRIVQIGGGIALAVVAMAIVIKPPIKVNVG